MLVDSPKFRSILSGGHIRLLDPDAVTTILEDPEVMEEINSIRNKTAEFYKETMPEALLAENTISVVILDLLIREADGSLSEAEAKDILNNREEELTDADLEHLVKNSTLAKVKKWSADTLADRAGEDA
jgi:hypothetical protein